MSAAARLVGDGLLARVEGFLYQEAELADEHCYDEWMALWTESVLYSVPCNSAEVDPAQHLTLIHDDRDKLEERLFRLKGRFAHSQSPRSSLCRVVSNVRLQTVQGDHCVVSSRFVLGEVRLDKQTVWIGRCRHMLVDQPDGLRMREKQVVLVNMDATMGSLTFII